MAHGVPTLLWADRGHAAPMTSIESIIRTVVREELERVTQPRDTAASGDLSTEEHVRATHPWRGPRPTSSGIAGEIVAELARQRKTRAWLAEQTAIPIATLSRRLHDGRMFRVGELLDITSVLGLDITAMLARA